MKREFTKAFLLLSVAMVGCQGNDLDENGSYTPSNLVDVVVSVGAPEKIGTRVSVEDETTEKGTKWILGWEDSDAVTCWDSANAVNDFTMSTYVDENNATFEGQATADATMRLIYPQNSAAIDTESGVFNIDLSTQNVAMSTDNGLSNHGDQNLYMISDVLEVNDYTTGNTESPVMRHMLAGMRLAITPGSVTGTGEIDGIYITGLSNKATVAFDAEVVDGKVALASQTEGAILLDVDGAATLGGTTQYIPFTTTPFEVGPGAVENIKFDIYLTDGKLYSYTKSYSALTENKEVKAGTVNTLVVSLDEFTLAVAGEYRLVDFEKWADVATAGTTKLGFPTEKTWTITDLLDVNGVEIDGPYANLRSTLVAAAPTEDSAVTLVFQNATALKSNALSGGTSGLNKAFYSVEAPMLKTVPAYAFYNNTNLMSVGFPEVTTIETKAFLNVKKMTSISLPKVTKLVSTFSGCSKLTSLELGTDGSGVETFTNDTFDGIATENIDLSIKLSAESNGSVEGNVLTIGDATYTFKSITATTADDVEAIQYTSVADFIAAANSLPAGSEVIINDTEATSISADLKTALNNPDLKVELIMPGINTLPKDGIVGALAGCTSLVSVSFPELTATSDSMFNQCTNLKSANFPKVTNLVNKCFFGVALTNITVGTSTECSGVDTIASLFGAVSYDRKANNIDLTIKVNTTDITIDGVKLTFGTKTYTFKSITVEE